MRVTKFFCQLLLDILEAKLSAFYIIRKVSLVLLKLGKQKGGCKKESGYARTFG